MKSLKLPRPRTMAQLRADVRVISVWREEGRIWIDLAEGWTDGNCCTSMVAETVAESCEILHAFATRDPETDKENS